MGKVAADQVPASVASVQVMPSVVLSDTSLGLGGIANRLHLIPLQELLHTMCPIVSYKTARVVWSTSHGLGHRQGLEGVRNQTSLANTPWYKR